MQISQLEPEIQELVFKRQQEQNNTPNATLDVHDCKDEGNFDWHSTPEGNDFWINISNGNTDVFYETYKGDVVYQSKI